MLPLSICLIAKNEQNCIQKCLTSLAPFLNTGAELVITDTGSTDRTKEIAAQYTNQIYDFTWCDDFSAARNYCASKAHNQLILTLDCDETLLCDDDSAETILQDILSHNPDTAGIIKRNSPTISGTVTVDPIARLYDKNIYHYHGIIHEQLFRIDDATPSYSHTHIRFEHSGYNNPILTQEKSLRNLQLLKQAESVNPNDVYTLFQIAQCHRMLSDYESALVYYQKALSLDVNPSLNYVKTLVESYGYTLLDLKRPNEVLSLYGVYDSFCDRADFVFLMGLANMQCGLTQEAIDEFKKAVTIPNYCVEGTNSYLAFYNLGVIYECMGNTQLAIEYYQKCKNYKLAEKRLLILMS